MLQNKKKTRVQEVHCPSQIEAELHDEFQILAVSINGVSTGQDWIITATLSNRSIHIKSDTGAQANLLSQALFLKVSEGRLLVPSSMLLTS